MYQALYRRYRPMQFDDVLGQDHIISTLKNQIANNNIGHAYLFSGTRGTGKTSTAKIFSRAVSCLNPIDSNPCNECQICRGILDGSIMDVIEMDAASNRGVNDIRELRDKVVYPPSYAAYKVYIIDEVHMLTQEAFNALLKTLEEPPKHLIFILATTEPERIPQTILSRCQRFDFKRITSRNIIKNMEMICEELQLEIEEDALRVIARNADGAMRDALSLLDQCISFSDGRIRYEDAISILGIVNLDIIFKIVDNIIDKDIEEILVSIDTMIQDGRDVGQFIKDIINHFRDLMIIKTSKDPLGLVEIDEMSLERYREQAGKLEMDYLLRILKILTDIDEESKLSTQPRILLEMGMIKIVREDNLSLEERIEKLEQGLVSAPIRETRPVRKDPVVEEVSRQEEVPVSDSRLGKEEVAEEGRDNKLPTRDGKVKELGTIKKEWNNILELIRQNKPSVAGVLREGQIAEYENDQVTIEFGKDFAFHMNAARNNEEFIRETISEYLNRDTEVRFEMEGLNLPTEEKKNEIDENSIKEVKDFFGEDKVKIIKE